MPRTFCQTHHDTQSHFFLHFKTLPKIIKKKKKKKKNKFLFIRLYVAPIPAPSHPYMRIACMHMTESVSFTSCGFMSFYITLHHFTSLCAPLRYFTPLYATLRYFTVFRQTRWVGGLGAEVSRKLISWINLDRQIYLDTVCQKSRILSLEFHFIFFNILLIV